MGKVKLSRVYGVCNSLFLAGMPTWVHIVDTSQMFLGMLAWILSLRC